MRKPYLPPEQSRFGQIIDVLVIVALVFGALWLPAFLGLTGAGTVKTEMASPTWEKLGQNAAMAAQWEKLGFTPETAAPKILTRFDYSIDPLAIGITILLIIFYFFFVLRHSEKEYREVISERFDDNRGTRP